MGSLESICKAARRQCWEDAGESRCARADSSCLGYKIGDNDMGYILEIEFCKGVRLYSSFPSHYHMLLQEDV